MANWQNPYDELYNAPSPAAMSDKVTSFLQERAAARQQAAQPEPTEDYSQMFNPALMGSMDWQPPQVDTLGRFKEALNSGDRGAANVAKLTKHHFKEPEWQDSAIKSIADGQENVDPHNSYQVHTALARFSKESGYSSRPREMPTVQETGMEAISNAAAGTGKGYFALRREQEKHLADLASSEALTGKRMAGGNLPASIQIANEIEEARQSGDLQRVATLERVHKMVKLGEGMTMTPEGVAELPGYGGVSGGIKGQERFGAERGGALGKNRGEKEVLIGQMTARIPQLIDVTQRLSQAGKKATYTAAGKLWNEARLQTGFDPREEATARTEYVSIVDNEVLPLLRETFGAQFTQKEGESLKVTLGDPNLQPAQKDAVLRSFLTSKMGTINSIARELGRPEPFTASDITSILAQITISQPAPMQSGNNQGWSIRKK